MFALSFRHAPPGLRACIRKSDPLPEKLSQATGLLVIHVDRSLNVGARLCHPRFAPARCRPVAPLEFDNQSLLACMGSTVWRLFKPTPGNC